MLALSGLIAFSPVSFAQTGEAASAAKPYKIIKSTQMMGTGGIDYVYADNNNRRLYVPRGNEVLVFDLDTLKSAGAITNARARGVAIDEAATIELARRSRGTPRIANRLLRRVRDFAEVRADGRITGDVCDRALTLLEVDQHGFDEADRRLLRTIIDKFGGGPVGLNSLAAAIGEEKDAIEDIYEPYLIQIGFLDRTPRGRVATARAYEYFGLTAPGKERLW